MNTIAYVVIIILIICCIVFSSVMLALGDNIPGVKDQLQANPQNRTFWNWGSGSSIALCSCLLLILIIVIVFQMMKGNPGAGRISVE